MRHPARGGRGRAAPRCPPWCMPRRATMPAAIARTGMWTGAPVAVEIHPGDDVPRLLGRALRLADAGPRPFYRAALVSLAVTSLGTMAIASFIDPGRTLRGPQRDMIDAALAAFCLSAVLAVLSLLLGGRGRPAWLDRAVDPQARAAILLALAAWFPFLLIVAY